MARLIKIEYENDKGFIILANILLLACSCFAFLNAVADWEQGRKGMTQIMLVLSAASAGLCDLSNRATKSQFALDRLQNEAEARQKARIIQAQEDALAADLSIARHRRLSELNLENAEVNADVAAQLLKLEHEYANLVAQLQEFE